MFKAKYIFTILVSFIYFLCKVKNIINMDSNNIELLGAMAVKKSIIKTKRLAPYIPENDKEPLWDGSVFLYRDHERNNDNFIYKVPTQVKGKISKDLSKKEISYPIEIKHLYAYQKDGGVIYFVVYLDENCDKEKIYYASLTPVNISFYLDEVKNINQKEKTIKLKEFPVDNSQKENIFFNFHANRIRQTSFVDQGFLSLENMQKETSIEYSLYAQSYHFGSPSNMYSLLFDDDIHIYATIKGNETLIPTNILSTQLEIIESIEETISIEKSIYYNKYERKISTKNVVIRIGDSITLTIPRAVDNSSSIETNITLTSSLKQIAIDLDFIINTFETNKFNIGKLELQFTPTRKEIDRFNLDLQKEKLIFYQKVIKLLDILNIHDDLDLSSLTKKHIRDLETLIKVFLDKEKVKNIEVSHSVSMIDLKIGNLVLKLIIKEDDKEKALYTIEDFFNANIHMSIVNEEGERYIVPPYSALKNNDYALVSNIDYENVLTSYQKLVELNDRIYEIANMDMLGMISGYDEKYNARLFDAIKSLSDWFCNTPNTNLTKEITLLNHLQIIKRERELSEKEKSELYSLIEDNSLSKDIKVASYLLLENQDRAEYWFNKLDKSVQDNFKTYPIYHFWNN